MHPVERTLEFDIIKEKLAEQALTDAGKERLLRLEPVLEEARCHNAMADTTATRTILDSFGSPPLPTMQSVEKALTLCASDAMLLPEQLTSVSTFAASCKRMSAYLAKACQIDDRIAPYGNGIADLSPLRDEIDRCIRGELVDSDASPALRDLRRKTEQAQSQIKEKLAAILRGNPTWFSDSYHSVKNGRYVLPVKREYRSRFDGSAVDTSGSGGTCFMEPRSVTKLQSALHGLEIDEDNEVRRILYTLTALVEEFLPTIRRNMESMVELDIVFAKAKLSAAMKAGPVAVTTQRKIQLLQGRHPLLEPDACVPLDFSAGGEVRGVIITGPNTGGKTVALKTVGLLSMMAQSGLHVPADPASVLCMHGAYHCDIGDGQSISENLSTFSGHMKQVISILEKADAESLVLLDELGSGTDPAEGMGIAVAVLEELRRRGCLFLVTTHYPQVKAFAEQAEAVISARMAFDRETLSPLYRLELGQSGESCALHIAKRLGFPPQLLQRAREEAYRQPETEAPLYAPPQGEDAPPPAASGKLKPMAAPRVSSRADQYQPGDSVTVYPEKEIGIVFQPVDSQGRIGIQVKGRKKWINHKRLKLKVSAADLYPEGYDLSVVLDSVENRKARHQMGKRHRPDLEVVLDTGQSLE